MGIPDRGNKHDHEIPYSNIINSLQEFCAQEIGAIDAKIIDPDKPFHYYNSAWGKRFILRNALLPWLLKNTALTTFYPDELQANSTPHLLAKHIADRLATGREQAVRPPIHPRKTGKIEEPTVFVLGCPRSGTTIFRCMLMGHSSIYAGPELHMIPFDSLLQRERALVEAGNPWMVMGFFQTIQDLTGWSEREAFHYISTLTKRDLPIEDVYRIIHGYSRKPILVDKSPTFKLVPSNLERIESRFSMPRYIYITRHPYAVIDSIVRLEAPPFEKIMDTPAAEKGWFDANTTIRAGLRSIPKSRWHHLSYEDLMQTTEQTLRNVTDFLGVAYEPSMADAYEGNRIQKGCGCVNLPKRSRVEPELADKWKTIRLDRPLLPETLALADALGYKCE